MSYKDDFESRSTLLNTYGNNALLLYALELRFEIADIFSVAGDALTDGGEDKKCDLIYIDQDTGIAVIAQGYMKQKVQEGDLAPENKASDLNTAAAWVFSQEPESVPERIRDQVRELQNAIKDDLVSTVYFWYVHNLNEKNNPKVREELTAMQINSNAAVKTLFPENKVDVFAIEVGNETIEKWYNASSSQITVVEKMTVDTVKKGFELVGDKWKAYVTAVTADWVKEQYCRYNDDIFSGNPRTYLGSGKKKNKINLGIIQTITEQPNNFWAYNNGITALVNDYSIENDLNTGEEKLTISGITIINGAQTTGAVSSVTEVGKALIPIRFIVCEDSSIIDEIINNNNKQNEIIASDLRSNDKVQNRLRNEFEKYTNLFYSGGRRGNGRPSRSREILDPYVVAQSISAFHGECVTAYNSRNDLWSNDRIYTSFEYEHLAVSEENDHTIVTVDVTNTGAVAAKHVVELFIEPKMKTRLPRPVRELKAFKKIFLQPGEKKQVCFSLERRDFAYYDPKVKDWVIENGAYAIEICHDSMNVAVSAEITKSGEKYLVPLGYDCGFYEMFQYPEVKKMFYEFLVEQGLVTADQVNDNLEKGIIWSFWAVRSYLDMNSNGLISFEAYNRFIDRANEVIKKMKAK